MSEKRKMKVNRYDGLRGSGEVGLSATNDLLCVGDINQGIGNALSIIRVNGHPDGMGLPESFIIEDTRTGRCMTYICEDT